jgi:site-specific recombinase XerD
MRPFEFCVLGLSELALFSAQTLRCPHPHTLRHSCGYYLAERGTEFRTMQDYMGHKNPRHTAHYTRISGRKFVGLFK